MLKNLGLSVVLVVFTGCASMQPVADFVMPSDNWHKHWTDGKSCTTSNGLAGTYLSENCIATPVKTAQTSSPPSQPYDACRDIRAWVMDPMSLTGHRCVVRLRIVQIIDKRSMLLNIEGVEESGGPSAVFYGRLISTIPDIDNLIDGQRVAVLAEVKGTHSYITTIGASSTVPQLIVRHVTVLQ